MTILGKFELPDLAMCTLARYDVHARSYLRLLGALYDSEDRLPTTGAC